MNALPESIVEFFAQHQVLSLAVSRDDSPWSANAFFAWDGERNALIILSSPETLHGRILAANPRVAGTIAGQFTDISQIHGLQYSGTCQLLDEPAERDRALALYYDRHPQARGMQAGVWEITVQQLKLTDNRLGFGTKIEWINEEMARKN